MSCLRSGLIGLSALMMATGVLAADMNAFSIRDRIKIPDGGFDYAIVESGRFFLPRTDFTTVVDVKTGDVTQLKTASRGHMALIVPGTRLLLLVRREGTVRLVDTKTDTVAADIPVGKNPNAAVYDPSSKLIFVANHDSGDLSAIDSMTQSVVATIAIGGDPQFPVVDGAGKIFVTVETDPQIVVVDALSRKVISHYSLAGCTEASGLAYINGSKLLIVTCGNGVAKVLNAETGKELASFAIGRGPDKRGPDNVLYDPIHRLAFIPCGPDGVLLVVSVADPENIKIVQRVDTPVGTRTGALDPETGHVLLMASKPDPFVPVGGGGHRLSGSFEVLVVGQ